MRTLSRREVEMFIGIFKACVHINSYQTMSCDTWSQAQTSLNVMGNSFLLTKGKVAYQLKSDKWFVEIRGMNQHGTGWASAVIHGDIERFEKDLILISMAMT